MSKLFYFLCRLLLVIAVWGFALSLILLALRLSPFWLVVAVLAVFAAVLRRRRRRTSDVHGTAKWCSEEDVKRAGML